jgi:hypothetical protein
MTSCARWRGGRGASLRLIPRMEAIAEALASLPGVQSAVTARGKLAFYEEYADDVCPAIESFIFP